MATRIRIDAHRSLLLCLCACRRLPWLSVGASPIAKAKLRERHRLVLGRTGEAITIDGRFVFQPDPPTP